MRKFIIFGGLLLGLILIKQAYSAYAPATKFMDQNGNAYGIPQVNGVPQSSTVQNVAVDTNNTALTGVTLNAYPTAGYEWSGSSTSTLGIVGIQVSLKTDVDCDVYIEQSPDGNHWDVSDKYHYVSSKANFGITVQAINSFVRVRVDNNDPVVSTYFRVQTCLCPVVEAVPRSLSSYGYLQTRINGIADDSGFTAYVSPNHQLWTATPYRLVGTTFRTAPDPTFWTLFASGTSSTATVNGICTLTSGTSANGIGQIQSVRLARHIIGQANNVRTLVRVTATTVSQNTRRWGSYSINASSAPVDGFCFELSSTAVLSCCCYNNGVRNAVASGSWNGNIDFYVMDTNMHVFEIMYGISGARFLIDGVLAHAFAPTTTPLCNQYDVPATAQSVNSASGSASATMEVWNFGISRIGPADTEPFYVHINGSSTVTCKIGCGRLVAVVCNTPINSAITVWDNPSAASGTQIASITSAGAANATPVTLQYDIPFNTGLTISNPATSDITVVFE